MNYAKLLEISFFFTWHIFLEVGETQDMPSKIWQTLGDALREKQLEFLLAITNHFSHSALILGPKYNQAQTKFVLDILEYSYLVLLWSTIFIFNHEYL